MVVATLHKLNLKTEFPDILQKIVQELGLYNISSRDLGKIQISHKRNEKHNDESIRRVERPYRTEPVSFDRNLLNYWAHYGIDEDTLIRFKVKNLRLFESISSEGRNFELTATPTEPMFAYIGEGYVKIYRPHSAKMRFLYGGCMPEVYCFGMEQIPSKGDILFITGGEKDVMSLSAHGFNAICFNSETAQIPANIIESLQLRFRHIILLYDADETGIREAQRQQKVLEDYKVLNLKLPLSGTKTEKDISDFFALAQWS